MPEREWLLPGIGLTILAAATALLCIPQYAGLLPALDILPAWMAAAALVGCVQGFAWMMRQRVDSPLAATKRYLRSQWRGLAFLTGVMLLAGLNLIAFMWIKPLLNYLVPFRADPLLADADHALFLGTDPWTLLQWLNVPAAGVLYHPAWFTAMIIALLMAARAPSSPDKSAVLLSYFVLWSLAGPLIHILLPAAGPVFYERMGYGPRFAGLDGGPETAMVADYLWSIYSTGQFGAGSGISAMPSMHVTISSWIVIVFHVFAPRWRAAALIAWLVIFLLSISLGWHYAVDGIVGAVAALACHVGLLRLFRRKAAGGGYVAPRSRGPRAAT